MRRITIILGATLALCDAARAGAPGEPPRPAQLGLCAACHGERGVAKLPGVPNLAAQRYAYLLDAMHQYRDGRRDVAVMRAALGPLGEAGLEALAHWYAAQSPAPPAGGGTH